MIFFVIFSFFLFSDDEIYIASPHPKVLKNEFEFGFKNFYQNKFKKQVTVKWLELGGTTDILRYVLRFGEKSGIDIIFGGGTDPFEELKSRNLLVPLNDLDEIFKSIPAKLFGLPLYDEEKTWISTNLSTFGLAYRSDKIHSGVEISWNTLASEELNGRISLSDPRRSGSARLIYEIMLQKYGWNAAWRLLYLMSHNCKTFGFHSSELIKKLSLGEIFIAPLVESHGYRATNLNPKINFTVPADLPIYFGDGIGILKGSQNLSAAKAAVEFALTDFQYILSTKLGAEGGPKFKELGRFPVLPRAYDSPHIVVKVNPYIVGANTQFNFNHTLGAKRWYEVSIIVGSIIVDLNYIFRALRREVIVNLPPPIDEQSFAVVVNSQAWRDVVKRDVDVARIRFNLINEIKEHANVDFN